MTSVTSPTPPGTAQPAVSRAGSTPEVVASRASRVASLAYGSAVYACFLVTFLYAIGFITGLGVPKTVDGGARGPLLEALLVNGGLLAACPGYHHERRAAAPRNQDLVGRVR